MQSDGSDDGELLFGGIDKAHYIGELVNVPLISESSWEVQMDALKFGSTSVSSEPSAIIDSGTSLLAGPSNVVKAIVDAVVARQIGKSSGSLVNHG